MSGNHSAASGDTKVKTAAGTSPLINRSIAFVRPPFSWTSVAPAAAIALRTIPLDADCLSSIATFLLVRSDTDLISWRAMRRATRRYVLFGDADAAAAVTCSATAVAAVTCSCIVLVLEPAEALPAGSSRACNERGESGMRNILKPAIAGNHSAVSGYTEVRTAAGTSPLINRSIALV